MGKYTKTNQSILKDGDVDFVDNQHMGGDGISKTSGNRMVNAGESEHPQDYIIKQQMDDHIAEDDPHEDKAKISDEPDPSELEPDHTHDPPYEYSPDDHNHVSLVDGASGYSLIGDTLIQWGRSLAIKVNDTQCYYDGDLQGGYPGGVFTFDITFPIAFDNNCWNIQLTTEAGSDKHKHAQIDCGVNKIIQSGGKDAQFQVDVRKIKSGEGNYEYDETFYVSFIAIGH